ncbi:4-hydroxy-tetrahydrodipicolinate reductase [Siphonobacter sp. BAB-5405]|uniref:4-hydroxy-tetrahydrodipicolinate reductase n=1 Tax=Siphonobacter sp. BAB-5405 TaxID=1864825 RepID=UPI000C80CD7E|nr:4-hydroxy-tetrahydrodipicolinate reductase [Siphonobacter sp. BAB-5405]PMD98362.1 4-hydroxy-tetrahydrodipicolinate reductase [Siphonobacter sp. BAB-5405]
MRIVLLGYGKMGKVIEGIALERGHEIVGRIDETNRADFASFSPATADVVIEFSHPTAALQNLKDSIGQGLPTVCGTTGWLEHRSEIEALTAKTSGAFFYASNYSIGVNLFFRLNKQLAKLISPYPEYQVEMTEIHHIHKKDAPSGTAITLAEGILEVNHRLSQWALEEGDGRSTLPIKALREGEVPGTHVVTYESAVDSIEIKHTAHNRQGFALGAVVAAEWLVGKVGVFGMDDLLGV